MQGDDHDVGHRLFLRLHMRNLVKKNLQGMSLGACLLMRQNSYSLGGNLLSFLYDFSNENLRHSYFLPMCSKSTARDLSTVVNTAEFGTAHTSPPHLSPPSVSESFAFAIVTSDIFKGLRLFHGTNLHVSSHQPWFQNLPR